MSFLTSRLGLRASAVPAPAMMRSVIRRRGLATDGPFKLPDNAFNRVRQTVKDHANQTSGMCLVFTVERGTIVADKNPFSLDFWRKLSV